MNENNKRNDLTDPVQSEVLKKFKTILPQDDSVKYYRVTDPTYYLVIKPEPKGTKRVWKPNEEQDLEDVMAKWYQQARDMEETITGKIIQEKAHSFHEKVGKTKTFKATSTWLQRFRTKFGSLNLQKNDQKNAEGIQFFSKTLRNKIVSENLSLENVYNADESGIYWKVPDFCTSSIETSEMKACRRNAEPCNRVTGLFCANATGNHQMPLFVIGENKTPDCLRDLITDEFKNNRLKFLRDLNVIYTHQCNSWMTKEIFKLWYKFVFIPNALNHQMISGTFGKIILILDNASCHPDLEELNFIHEQFEIIYLPPYVTSNVQPTEQLLMPIATKIYKRNLLTSMFKAKLHVVDDFWNTFTLKDCLTSLGSAWECINSSYLRIAWSLLLGDYCDVSSFAPERTEDDSRILSDSLIEDMSQFPDEICDKLIARHSPGADYSIRKLQKDRVILVKWFKVRDDFGWKPLTDDEIIDLVLSKKTQDPLKIESLDSESGCETSENNQDATSSGKNGSDKNGSEKKAESSKQVVETLEKESEIIVEDGAVNETNSNQVVEESDNQQIVGSNQVSSLEAFAALMKVKKWMSSCDKSSEKHRQCVVELENLISKNC